MICVSVASRSAAWPPIRPSTPTAVASSDDERRGERGLIVTRQRAERQIQQPECREDRDRFAELPMVGRPSAPQRRIVHRRQIVEDERRRVNELDDAAAGSARADVPPHSSAASIVRTGRTRLDGAWTV